MPIPFLNDATEPLEGRRVRVHRNLHRKCWSVQEKVDGAWRVVAHAARVELVDVAFNVRRVGRRRAVAEQRRNVHAFAAGIVSRAPERLDHLAQPVGYNPFVADHFVDRIDGAAVLGAYRALFYGSAWAIEPRKQP